MIPMPWGSAQAALAARSAHLCGVPVLLAIEALREPTISVIQFALLELTLKEKPFVDEQIGLFR